jgi:glutamate racemase
MPEADYLYFGDTARLPYGSKSAQTVAKYAVGAAKFLESHGAKHIVIGCNTATALALDAISAGVSVPVLGVIAPGATAAAAASKTKRAMVIATEGTVNSHAYQRELSKLGLEAEEKACPLFVPLVEEGWLDHPVTESVARIYLEALLREPLLAEPLLAEALLVDPSAAATKQSATAPSFTADVLLLGCTHYPLLKGLLRRLVPQNVAIVDSAESTAQEMQRRIAASIPNAASTPNAATTHTSSARESSSPISPTGRIEFFATDSVEKFRRAGEKFLGRTIQNVTHVEMES